MSDGVIMGPWKERPLTREEKIRRYMILIEEQLQKLEDAELESLAIIFVADKEDKP